MVDLDHLYKEGAAAWPAIAIPIEAFAAAAADRVGGDEPVLAGDLYLAVGLGLGLAAAVAAFEAELVPRLRAALGRAGAADEQITELVQELRVRILVGDGARPARIADYAGRGSLIAWLKVAALRMLANQRRGAARTPWRDGRADLEAAAPGITPDRLLLDQRYGPALREALATGLRALAPRDQTLLRLHYVEGVALDRIGALYGAHKSTVSRWLAAAREGLLAHAIAAVRAIAGGGDTAELESLCASLCSQLELSLSKLAP
ncbi:MAG: transcriptional regulator [Deltaproteobacteria bacterium]|nr:transcriptional regulator [Deltaproteobacteria bacterium]